MLYCQRRPREWEDEREDDDPECVEEDLETLRADELLTEELLGAELLTEELLAEELLAEELLAEELLAEELRTVDREGTDLLTAGKEDDEDRAVEPERGAEKFLEDP